MHSEIKYDCQQGYILPSLVGLLSLVSLATLTAFNHSATDIQIQQAEKNMAQAFAMAENHLITAEQALLAGVLRTDLVEIKTFSPKNFKKRAGTDSTHYQLTATEYLHQTVIEIQVTLRIHEKTPAGKHATIPPPNRTLERISWEIL